MAAAAIVAECIFGEVATDIVIGERCSRVKRNCSFYRHVAHWWRNLERQQCRNGLQQVQLLYETSP